MGILTPQQKTLERVRRRFAKAMVQYALVEEGDHLLVGLSGGKDSLALLELLAQAARIYRPRFRVSAAHVVMSNIPYRSDEEYLRSFCAERGVEFHRLVAGFDRSTDQRKSPCFLCSWNRRKALFEAAKSLGCNKIALGHHQDDFLVTLLMNMTFQGAVSAMTPKMVMKKFDMTVIRPLCLVAESELAEMARINGYRKQIKNCPHEHESNRAAMQQLLARLEELNGEARYNLWSSMTNIQTDLLPPAPVKEKEKNK